MEEDLTKKLQGVNVAGETSSKLFDDWDAVKWEAFTEEAESCGFADNISLCKLEESPGTTLQPCNANEDQTKNDQEHDWILVVQAEREVKAAAVAVEVDAVG